MLLLMGNYRSNLGTFLSLCGHLICPLAGNQFCCSELSIDCVIIRSPPVDCLVIEPTEWRSVRGVRAILME